MNTTNLNIRTDKEIKLAAEKIFEELGLNMTTAVNMFLRQTIRENGIPFSLKLEADHDNTTPIEMTDDEKIDFVAARVLKQYRRAFEELAK